MPNIAHDGPEVAIYAKKLVVSDVVKAVAGNESAIFGIISELSHRTRLVDPNLHSLLPEATRESRLRLDAEAMRQHHPNESRRPRLYGVPFGVKDMLRTSDLPTQAGSRLPATEFSGAEATSVRILREAGGLVFGKTQSSEFAYFQPGPTLNPHNTSYSPGGSSSGSAAAVAAGLCPFALGTQTIGSIIKPASFCGIVGYKPSHARIPRDGMVFCAESLDDIGVLAQDVDGVKTVASLLCADWAAEQADTTNLDLPTLGVPEGPYLDQMPPSGLARFQSLLEELQALGYHVKTVPLFEQLSYIKHSTEVLVAREMAEVHRNWFSSYERLYAARTRENIIRGQSITESEYQAARDHRAPAREEVEQQAERFGIDSWIAPATLGPAPVGTNTTGDSSMNLPWSYVGLPAVTCPAWKTAGGLPVGLQLIGRSGSDEHLLAYADDLSRRLDGRVTAPIW